VRRLRLPAFVRGEVLDHFRLEERARVSGVLIRHARRDVLPALPQRCGVEETAVAAAVELRAALHAQLVERRLLEADALLAAFVALEDFRSEAAGGSPARRALDPLALRLRPRPLRACPAVGVRAVAASILISTMFVLTIAHFHLTNT